MHKTFWADNEQKNAHSKFNDTIKTEDLHYFCFEFFARILMNRISITRSHRKKRFFFLTQNQQTTCHMNHMYHKCDKSNYHIKKWDFCVLWFCSICHSAKSYGKKEFLFDFFYIQTLSPSFSLSHTHFLDANAWHEISFLFFFFCGLVFVIICIRNDIGILI